MFVFFKCLRYGLYGLIRRLVKFAANFNATEHLPTIAAKNQKAKIAIGPIEGD